MKQILLIASILLATASAGYARGKCPTVSSIAYQSSMDIPIEHWMLYADKTVMSYVNPVSKFIPPSVMVNLTCLNAGKFGVSQ